MKPTLSTSRLLQPNTQTDIYTIPFGFILLDSNNQYINSPLLLQLQVANFYHKDRNDNKEYSPNSIYGYSNSTSNTIDILYNKTGNLYAYGKAYNVILLAITIIFLSHLLTYKTDNLFITLSVVYLTLPTLNLIPSSSTYNCYSFLYGFSWSSYL